MTIKTTAGTYPVPVSTRAGSKVGWYTYNTHKEALQASVVAEEVAARMWMEGYDFGYQIPGRVTKNSDGTYTVVVP
jgi:hypothetical protein